MTDIEKFREALKPFNLALIAEEAKVCHVTLSLFRQGRNKTISADNYIKVKVVLDKIAKDILGVA